MKRHLRHCMLGSVAALLFAPPVRADSETRLVAIDADDALLHAMDVALGSSHVQVVPMRGPAPDGSVTETIRTSHRFARQANAQAVLWLACRPASCDLWLYDDRTHQVAARSVEAAPPHDEAAAAALALTVKTLLRNVLSARAPQPEDEEQATAPKPPRASTRHTLRIETFGAARMPTNATDRVAYRIGFEAAWFPRWMRQALGLALGVDFGPAPLQVDRWPVFSGTFSDVTTNLTLRGRIPLRRWMSLELGAGPALHFGTLDGSASSGGLSGRVSRTDPALDVLLALELGWGLFRVGTFVGVSALTRYQRYHVGPALVLQVPPTQVQMGLRVGVEFP